MRDRVVKMQTIAILEPGYANYQTERSVLAGFDAEIVPIGEQSDAVPALKALDPVALLVRETEVGQAELDACPNLKVIVRYGVGVDNINRDLAARRGVYVANVPDYGAENEVSEHALALYLSVQRRIVSRDAEVRGALGSLLRSAGHDVALHEETDDFLASGQANRADCLVLDIRLRGESGLDFQERLAEQGIRIPVILMTGYGDIPMTVRGMKAGAVDFLPKPFSDDQMLTAVAAAIEASRTQRAKAAKAIAVQEAHDRLTPREREVMALVVTGLMNKQVAARLNLSEITVKIHRGNVMRKMAAQSLADLVRMAEQLGVRDDSIHRFNI